MSTKLFVGNISFNTTEGELNDAFAAHGTVVEAHLMLDRMSGRPRGFGFVTMGSPEEAQAAIEAMHGTELDGRPLTVNVARPVQYRAWLPLAYGKQLFRHGEREAAKIGHGQFPE